MKIAALLLYVTGCSLAHALVTYLLLKNGIGAALVATLNFVAGGWMTVGAMLIRERVK